jgi:hypothetical protein
LRFFPPWNIRLLTRHGNLSKSRVDRGNAEASQPGLCNQVPCLSPPQGMRVFRLPCLSTVMLFPWRTSLNIPQGPRAYGQARGVIPFSCAYLAADASTKGRTSA